MDDRGDIGDWHKAGSNICCDVRPNSEWKLLQQEVAIEDKLPQGEEQQDS